MKPNGKMKHTSRGDLKQLIKVCDHPKPKRLRDLETGEIVCQECGEVLQVQAQRVPDAGKFGRGPENFAVFRNNLGSTSKKNNSQPVEAYHLHAISEVYGNRYGKIPSKLLTKTCPECGQQNHLKIFGDDVTCEKCKANLAHYVLRWLPNGSDATRFWADLRLLQGWDGPEDDALIKLAREIFSEQLGGRLSPEDASRVAGVYLKSVNRLISEQRHDLKSVLTGLLDSILTVQGVKA
jgi:hypothetical protein